MYDTQYELSKKRTRISCQFVTGTSSSEEKYTQVGAYFLDNVDKTHR